MKKIILLVLGVVILVGLAWAGNFYWKNLRGIAPALKPAPEDIVEIINITGMPLSLPEGFSIEIFAEGIDGARVIIQDEQGNFWISQPKEGSISFLRVEDGEVVSNSKVFRDLNNPHGLAIDPQDPFSLYVAEEDKISRFRIYTGGGPEKIIDLPIGGRHTTRTLAFGPDGRLYVSIGSSCDTCIEDDERRGAIYSMNSWDGSDFKSYATGLRNAVFFAWDDVHGRMWATEMGRDLLGDDLPPDEINIIEEGENYGWPFCYGDSIQDIRFDDSADATEFCLVSAHGSHVDLQAHSAPLGLGFVPREGWGEEYWYDILVAYHGSWNRTEPTGYKIARIKLNEDGEYLGTEDFITGWLTDEGALGRPVDVLVQEGGVMYITDDKAGVVYRVFREI